MTIRLVYGPALYAGYDGIVVDAAAAEQLGRLSRATTVGEAADVLDIAATDVADDASAEDPFDFEEAYMERDLVTPPAELAWETAGLLVRHLRRKNLDALRDVEEGGGTPGGNMNAIVGPLDQLATLATLIDPERDGFTLKRHDDLVDVGMARHLFV